jgi:glycosyltransferase involved in cell wall biosynthesis
MSRIVLIEPAAEGILSGGYLYNAKMSAHGAWEMRSVRSDALASELDQLAADLVLADSIWLTERAVAPFFSQMTRRGIRLGFLMHSFPSMIARAEQGLPIARDPTPFEVETLRRAHVVLAPGPHYQDLLRRFGVKVHIAEPGIDDTWRVAPRRRIGPCSLVSVGAVTPRKGALDLLRVLVDHPMRAPWQLTVIGSLRVRPAYAAAVAELAAALPTVTLRGQLTPQEVQRSVSAADILVMPSYDENHPLVLLEAMASSVPAVGYAAGAAQSIVRHGCDGLVGPVGDKEQLAANLARLVENETERLRMAEACWLRQPSIPSWATAARQARALLETIATAS